ncbi:ATP-binding cassette domain-containing protein [Candidatus Acetothermia bacterium]|jgi:ABC-2 type transport system ATP-binding protein|nr:ATP-binding cassette domain-containing protein [Candidatus Acetothermia bacterium]MCI2431889.1 ATP-binding cassette domain-containing protein [Candidatus Acetothermia bacterium]MCI2437378.1 ATP-binding cassette domain-containing protein [Candidatus Acetothermia bacterium]
MSQRFAIQTEGLGRVYQLKRKRGETAPKTLVALEGVDSEVKQGELFGLLGPNGAGKTTLIKILTTLLLPTSGRALVDGIDIVQDPQEVRRRINMVSGGETCGYGLLTVEENLWMFTQFYGLTDRVARERINEMLEVVGLSDRRKTKSHFLSTGMKQKMNFARGFLNDPQILFLDEPTLGLDVQTSRVLRDFVKRWVRERPGKTLLLTTHYMAEADELCDRVAIIDKGKILACDTPANLKRRLQRASIFKLQTTPLEMSNRFSDLPGVSKFIEHQRNGHTELNFILENENVLVKILDAVQAGGGHLLSLEKREPTLEDVFIDLVGRGFGDEETPLEVEK